MNHEDLIDANIDHISGIIGGFISHRTSVIGEILMVNNTVGGVGIAPKCSGRVISQHQDDGYNTAAAIMDAICRMEFGNVLLLKAQEQEQDSGPFLPVEIHDENFQAIQIATERGIVVIEAGSNESYDLDGYENFRRRRIFDRNSLYFRDSGAIMVGASSSA